ncbi:MAG: SUMF1/EgtB/PvdO family nonheme iron enzyme [Caldilineaceae bacterium]|nr:SUMF1/EgtB/PvdO family nonheme iron enzyme [Caldilineaceae bacterium]
MTDGSSTEAASGGIQTAGGAAVGGDVATQGGAFIGRDHILNVTINVSGEKLQELSDTLARLLAAPDARLRANGVTAGDHAVEVPPELADALRQYLDAAPGGTQAERERQYLLYLCVNPDFHQWQQRYVALSGGYRAVPELTPAYSAIFVRGEGPQRQIERVPLPDIRTALDNHARFILLAEPGAGKTTVLQRIALDKALAYLQGQHAALLPLFVRLSAQGVNESPLDFLVRMWRDHMPGAAANAADELRRALRQGRLCLLVDALNEARREQYTERMHDWRDFAAHLPVGNQLLFSCRRLDYAGELAVQQVEIDPLTTPKIQEFARRYLDDEQGAAFWTALRERHVDLLELAAIPYYLHMLVEVYAAQDDLPANRAQLFEQFVFQLFQREQGKRHEVSWIEPAAQHLALSELAFAMQTLNEGAQVEQAWALATLPTGDEVATPPRDVLTLARAASFLAGGDGQVKFTHHLMQEYFAAEALLRRLVNGDDLRPLWHVPSGIDAMPPAERGEWDPLPGPPTTGWEETTILAAGLSPALYDAVQPINPALAARCLLESGAEQDETRRAQSQSDLLARLGNVAIHLRCRIEAGLLLGRLGDPRFGVESVNGVQVILPPLVEIAGAVARIGSGLWRLFWERQRDEYPRHAVTLAGYALGRYPVTNAEYACFMAAGGYEEERYWTAGGRHWRRGEPIPGEEDPADWWMDTWRRRKQNPQEIEERLRAGVLTAHDARNWRGYIQWSEEAFARAVRQLYPQQGEVVREPRFWRDAAFNNPSQPVVGVCWYEAMAYANWLAALTSQPFRLPSEPEWEWAARRGGRLFPWGSGWDAGRLNSLEGENRVMRTTPVGAYPHGATPDGIHDLAGNVWEWTATRGAAYPYRPEANLEDPDAAGLRIVRGGGWAANRKMVRCAFRFRINPWHGIYFSGFRLARPSR